MPDRDFLKLCKVATEKLFAERRHLKRVAVRIGFWPDGMVLTTTIRGLTNAELDASMPKVIPWAELETITEAELIHTIEQICNRAREALKPARAS